MSQDTTTWLLLIQAAATWGMVGLIWFVQIVHYPLYTKVGPEQFVTYQQAHTQLVSLVVIPLMLAELFAAVLLAVAKNPVFQTTAWVALALVLAIWAVTFTVQVPQHNRLCQQFDLQTAQQLVRGNWIRTFLWSCRGGIVIWMLERWVNLSKT